MSGASICTSHGAGFHGDGQSAKQRVPSFTPDATWRLAFVLTRSTSVSIVSRKIGCEAGGGARHAIDVHVRRQQGCAVK
jgi:hypothetical protein